MTKFWQFKFWISKNYNFKPYFEIPNDFSWKCHEYQSFRTHQDLQLLFWSSFRVTKLEQFKFWILKNNKFKLDFKTPNDFIWKSDEYQSCRTHQDLQLLFWSFLHPTKFRQFKIWIVQKESHENMTKIKVVDLDEFYNFYIYELFSRK